MAKPRHVILNLGLSPKMFLLNINDQQIREVFCGSHKLSTNYQHSISASDLIFGLL